ncbi:MAG: ribosome hibernation-promoting factor, HPF/YfiA family [Candidatus Komeilibacteria bacterium]
MKVIIQGTGMTLTPIMRKFISDKMKAVDKFYPNIIELRFEAEHLPQQTKGDRYRCEANVSIPGKLIRVDKTTNDFQKSVNKVKDHLKVVLAKEKNKRLTKRKA